MIPSYFCTAINSTTNIYLYITDIIAHTSDFYTDIKITTSLYIYSSIVNPTN